MNNPYDILILGSGPIGASTAYFLTQQTDKQIGLVTQDPTDSHEATYAYAGGCVRWFWPEELKVEMTRVTASFIDSLDEKGVDLSLLRDNYLFLNRGKYVPSLNISSKKLMDWFLQESVSAGLQLHAGERIVSVTKEDDEWMVKTSGGEYRAKTVLCALGAKNTEFVPWYELELEERELYVLDLPVGEEESRFPHTVIPVNDGVAYVFVKRLPEGLRFVVGQEGVVEDSEPGDKAQFGRLVEAGLGSMMPFLENASVEKVLWGTDVENKTLKLEEKEGLFVANCGSAVRGCVWIGTEIAKKLTDPADVR